MPSRAMMGMNASAAGEKHPPAPPYDGRRQHESDPVCYRRADEWGNAEHCPAEQHKRDGKSEGDPESATDFALHRRRHGRI